MFSSEHLASHGVFFVCQIYVIVGFVRQHINDDQFFKILKLSIYSAVSIFAVTFFYVTLKGITRWSGRSMTLLDPTYAKKYIPIIASVSEHQPTTWGTYFFDLSYLLIFIPAGFYFSFRHITYGKLFIALYGLLSVYFACIMIRLMLVLAPAACVLAAISISEVLDKISKSIRHFLRSWFEENAKVEEATQEENQEED